MLDVFAPAPVFAALPQHAGVRIEERLNFGLANVLARKGADAERIGAALGLTPPRAPAFVGDDDFALIGAGPGAWLALKEEAPADWAGDLSARLDGLASVVDQGGAYALLRLSGARARDLLSRGAFIDLRPDRFGPGAAATTSIAHVNVTFWAREAQTFELVLFRSYAHSFAHWLETALAGLDHGASATPG